MSESRDNTKPQIPYPNRWLFKVIGATEEQLRKAISDIVQGTDYCIRLSNTSKTGRYHCLDLEMTVHSEENRNQVYLALKSHPSVTLVL